MHTTPPDSGNTPTPLSASRLNRDRAAAALPARAIVAWTVAAATLSTVISGVVPAGIAQTGLTVFPGAFTVIAVLYALFAPGFLAAARRFPAIDASGAFYTVIRHGLGRVVGVGAAWIATVAYAVLTVGLYGLAGSMVTPLVNEVFGMSLPWQVVAVTAVMIVAGIGLAGLDIGTRILKVLIALEIVMIAIVTIANFTHPSPGGYTAAPFDLTAVPISGLSAVLALGVLGYVGTELTVVYSHNSRDGAQGVARATYATIAILTVVYVGAAYSMIVTLGSDTILTQSRADAGGVFVGTAAGNLGPAAALLIRAVVATSVLAGAVSFHWATSRYALVLARDRAAPAILGRTGRGYGAPVTASLAQTVLALAAVVAVTVTGADPVLVLFYVAGTAGSIGILLVLGLAALAIVRLVAHRDPARSPRRARRGLTLVTSVVSTVLLVALLVSVLTHLDVLLSVSPGSPIPVTVTVGYLTVFGLGALWAAIAMRKSAATATAPPPDDAGTGGDL